MDNNTSVYVGVDWLTITHTSNNRVDTFIAAVNVANEMLDMMGVFHTEFPKPGKNQRFYAYVFDYDAGLIVSVAENMHMQGAKVTMSGTYLQGKDAAAIIGMAIDAGYNITRIDIAIDLHGFPFSVMDVAKERQSSAYIGRKRVVTVIDGVAGATLYVGSRQSEKMVRVYDKAAEQGVFGAWIRCEVEYKGDTAKNAGMAVVGRNWGMFASDVRAFVSAPDGLINRALSNFSPQQGIKALDKSPSITRWFEMSVIPALDKARAFKPSEYAEIMDMLRNSGHS
jgi:hypothetical protein